MKRRFRNKTTDEQKFSKWFYASHPFDVIGYDGLNYPYAFSIHDFEPITGRIHYHHQFKRLKQMLCNLIHLYQGYTDYHPLSIPCSIQLQ